MKRIVSIGIVILIVYNLQNSPLLAQQLVLKTYDRSSGLASDFVMNMFQDNDGFIWFATDRGVSRYDGKSFTNYTTREGLPDNFVQYVTQDNDGYLWFGIYERGAVRFDGKRFQSFTTTEGLPGNTISWITQDKTGRVYIRSTNGLSVLHNGKVTARQNMGQGEGIQRKRNDPIYISKGDSIFRIEPTEQDELHLRKLCVIPLGGIIFIGSFEQDSRAWNGARLYAGSYGGVSLLKFLNDTTLVPVARYIVGRNVGSIVHEGDSVLWCGTLAEGIAKITPAGVTHFGTKEGLLQERVETLMRDYEGNLWLSTFGSGVQKLAAPSVVRYTKEEGLPNNYVSSLYEDSDGRMWFGTSAGLAVLSQDSVLRIAPSEKYLREIRSIAQDANGEYYIGTFEYLFGPHSFPGLRTADTLKRLRIGFGVSGIFPVFDSILTKKKKPSVWLGSFGGGITHLNDRDSTVYTAGGKMCSNVIEDVISFPSSAWFISRNGGATRMKGNQFQLFSDANGLPSNSVFSVYEDSSGSRIWIGTDAGLTLIENNHVRTFSERDGLLGNHVIGIYPRGKAFSQDNDEMLIITPKALHRFHNGTIHVISTLFFTQQASVSVNDMCYSAKNDVLWFATPNGAYKLSLSSFRRNSVPPRVAISTVSVDTSIVFVYSGVNEARNETPELPYFQNNITIEYTGLSFVNENDISFRFKLEPFDKTWSQPGKDNRVQFRNLDNGEYTFVVEAINADDIASAELARFSFRILPPFWKRWWFLTLSGMALFGTTTGIVRYISQRNLRKKVEELERQHELQQERDRISRDLHDNVGAQMVSIISGLELAGRYSDVQPKGVKPVLESLKEDARITMALLRETIWALQSSSLTIEGFAHELEQYIRKQLRYHPSITLVVSREGKTDAKLRPVEAMNLLRIVQEALSNSLKHAAPTVIDVGISVSQDNIITVQFKNDGCSKEPDKEFSGGKGLANMERRARELGGEFGFSLLEGEAACVTISTPLKKEKRK